MCDYVCVCLCLCVCTSGFPCGSAAKESACNVGDLGSIPGLGASPDSDRRVPAELGQESHPQWQPTPVFLTGESQGWGSSMGCHLWGRTESDMTEGFLRNHAAMLDHDTDIPLGSIYLAVPGLRCGMQDL